MDFLKVSDRTTIPYRSNSLFGMNQQPYKDVEIHPYPHLITPYAGNGVVGCCYYHPFTNAQLKELERQAMIYKYMIASIPVPFDLLVSATPCNNNKNMAAGDLEPGRCRRTDGKKWRCSKEVVSNHKYCERHLHRGRPRSRKHVEPPYSRPINNDRKRPLPKEISSSLSRARTEQENKYLNFIDIWSDGVRSSEKQSTTSSSGANLPLDLSMGGNNQMGHEELGLIQMGLGVTASDHGYGPYGMVSSWLAPATPGGPLAEILRPNPNLAYNSTPTLTPIPKSPPSRATVSMSDGSSQI